MEMQAKQPTAAGRYEPWPHRGVWEMFVQGKCCYLQRIGAGAACRPNCALLEEE